MGGGAWSANTHRARTAAKKAKGVDTFDYDQHIKTKPRSQWTVADRLDPLLKAGDQSPHVGQVMRECMITDEHPDPTPVVVFFDVTGSMGMIPRTLQQKLANLHGLLVRKGYAADPQILMGAIGDANCDALPLQVGQFESDNRLDEDLEAIVLEGGGGGHMKETYELGAYFLAEHTYLEPYEKHGKKGYAFFIGDERTYPQVKRGFIERWTGDSVEGDVDTRGVFEKVKERYETFFIYPKVGSYSTDLIIGHTGDEWATAATWRSLLGERAIVLEDPEMVCELIATTIGLTENTVSLDDGLADLKDTGASDSGVAAVGKALAAVGGGNASAVATTSGELPGLD